MGVCTLLVSASAGGPKAPETHVLYFFLPGPGLWASCHSFGANQLVTGQSERLFNKMES